MYLWCTWSAHMTENHEVGVRFPGDAPYKFFRFETIGLTCK